MPTWTAMESVSHAAICSTVVRSWGQLINRGIVRITAILKLFGELTFSLTIFFTALNIRGCMRLYLIKSEFLKWIASSPHFSSSKRQSRASLYFISSVTTSFSPNNVHFPVKAPSIVFWKCLQLIHAGKCLPLINKV